MGYWSVAMCKSSSENIAKFNLERQHFETYLPKFISRNGKETKVKVLFPRYVFIKIQLQWYSIRGTKGITKLLMRESSPAVVPDSIIENLKRREDSKGFIILDEPPKFRLGERVRVVNSAMSGYIGIYDGMRDHERARVLIELLGQQVPVEMDETDLVAVAVVK